MSCFLLKVIKNGLVKKSYSSLLKETSFRHYGIWEPDYLILAKTKTPEHDAVNFQIKGYDFVILEKYQRVIERIANSLKIDNIKSWATPCCDLKVVDVKSHIMPLLIEAAITACPPGVKLHVHEHNEAIEEDRYVPDVEVMSLEQQLESLKKNKNK